MRHTVVIHLKNSSVIHGYYRSDRPEDLDTRIPSDLPHSMTIEPEDGGPATTINLEDTKAVFFVQTFTGSPSQQEVRFFDSLAIHPFLWARLTFNDGEIMEGRVSNDIDLLTKQAFRLFPVDELANNRCLFVPKKSLQSFQVIGLLEEGAGATVPGDRRELEIA